MRLSTHCRSDYEDFRYGLKDEQIKLLVRWAEPAGNAIAGALKVLISARNLSSPMETTVPVRFEAQLGDTEAMVTALIEEELDVPL